MEETKGIYNSREEEIRATISKNEAIRLIEEKYPANYSPTSGLDAWDQLLACEAVDEATPVTEDPQQEDHGEHSNKQDEGNTFSVKGEGSGCMVKNPNKYDYDEIFNIFTTKRQTSKEDLAFFLANALEDIASLSYYEKLVKKHRTDLLRNCLIITLTSFSKGRVTTTKGAYFTGVFKNKIAAAERLKHYKQNHTT